MDKKDMIRLIKAFISINKINDRISEMTGGCPINSNEYNGIYELYDVIFDHSKFAGRDDDEALDQFRDIMYRENISAEECYEALK